MLPNLHKVLNKKNLNSKFELLETVELFNLKWLELFFHERSIFGCDFKLVSWFGREFSAS